MSDYTQLKVGTLYNLRTRGEGPRALRCGGRTLRYRKSDVDAWLEEHADPMPA